MSSLTFNHQISDFRPALFQSALKYTNNHDDANDLVQDTFIKAIKYESKYKEGTNLYGWLFTIMKNTFINNYWSVTRRTSIIQKNVDPSFYPVGSTSKNNCEGKFVMDDVNKALNSLDAIYKDPFLRYFEGYKYAEIAVELDIPIGTVKTRIHIARKILKGYLKMHE